MTQFYDPSTMLSSLKDKITIASPTETYYMCLSDIGPPSIEEVEGSVAGDDLFSKTEFRRRLFFGKRMNSEDNIGWLIPTNQWQSGTVYAQWDDADPLISQKAFYVSAYEGRIYKCISNNNGAPSTVSPSSRSSTPVEVADGYVWKHMFLPTASMLDISGYVRIMNDSSVASAAVPGSIEHVEVEDGGSGWLPPSVLPVAEKLSNTLLRLSDQAEGSLDFYKDSLLYVSAGTGSGTFSPIASSYSNASGKYVSTSLSLPTVVAGSTVTIAPQVKSSGDGTSFYGYLVASAGGHANKVVVVNRGSDFTAASMTVKGGTGTGAVLRAIMPPPGGHGANSSSELFPKKLVMAVELPSFNGVPPRTLSFGQIGVMKNPRNTSNTVINANTVDFYSTFNLGTASAASFASHETVRGNFSNATAHVVKPITEGDTDILMVTCVKGTFQPGEVVVGETSGFSTTLDSITVANFKNFSGELMYFTDVPRVNRMTSTVSEVIRVVIDVEG